MDFYTSITEKMHMKTDNSETRSNYNNYSSKTRGQGLLPSPPKKFKIKIRLCPLSGSSPRPLLGSIPNAVRKFCNWSRYEPDLNPYQNSILIFTGFKLRLPGIGIEATARVRLLKRKVCQKKQLVTTKK